MAAVSDWDPITGLPATLEKLLEETEINNSFLESSTTEELLDVVESSYNNLYKMQDDAIKFEMFHYQTRQFLLDTTFNDIQLKLREYGDELVELERTGSDNIERINELKRLLADLGETRFGDLYIESNYNRRDVCLNVPFDIVEIDNQLEFRQSDLHNKNISISDIIANKRMFNYIPIVIIDGVVKNNLLLKPIDQGTRFTFPDMNARDVYNTLTSQNFHDICVIFVDNDNTRFIEVTKEQLLSGNIPFTRNYKHKGVEFISVYSASTRTGTRLIPTVYSEDGLTLSLTDTDRNNIESTGDDFTVVRWFFKDLKRFIFTSNSVRGEVTTGMKYYYGDEREDVWEGKFFIPVDDDGKYYELPIPEKNIFILKGTDGYNVPTYQCGVKLYYPNIYKIDDPNANEDSKYEVYYFYQDFDTIHYTPLFEFYWEYLQHRFKDGGINIGMEDVINKIYFRDEDAHINYSISVSEPDPSIATLRDPSPIIVDEFYYLFDKMLEYMDYRYLYGTPDFFTYYEGEEIPLQYKIARMMEFVRSDWKNLRSYVKRQNKKSTIYHFFTNTINLADRIRISNRREQKEDNNYIIFSSDIERTTSSDINAVRVVTNETTDYDNEICIKDAIIHIPNITDGEYVKYTDLRKRYVFTFKNDKITPLSLKVYIDGLLCGDIITTRSLGMEYVYIPVDMVSENSYIMIEIEHGADYLKEIPLTFNNSTEWKTVHLVEDEEMSYTMNDICIYQDGELISDKSLYTVKLIRNEVAYDMIDERHGVTNKYGIVTDIKVQMTHVDVNPSSDITLIVNKTSFIAYGRADRNGYPRFSISDIKRAPDIGYARMYYNGSLVPPSAFRLVNSTGRIYFQSRIFCETGDNYFFEFSPYCKDIVCEMDEFDMDSPLDLSKYIDKPIDPEYYEVYVNGRRLGLPNVFAFGAHNAVFKGLKSKNLLVIYEKERDFEYYGYSKVFKEGEYYYYDPADLVKENFVTKQEVQLIIDNYIEKVKHKDAIILPNEDVEEKISFNIETGLVEEMKIFFFEELLPLGLGNPDTLQFNKQYIEEVFPNFAREFMQDSGDGEYVVFLDPDVSARIYDIDTNDYEIIQTSEVEDTEKAFVMISGESKWWKEN